MFKTLRSRLVLSHIFPILITIPIMGGLLLFELQSHYLMPEVSRDLSHDATLISNLVGSQPKIWQNPDYARSILEGIYPGGSTRVMLLRLDGSLLASTDSQDANLIDQIIPVQGMAQARQGILFEKKQYSNGLRGPSIDVLAPVFDSSHQVTGFVRLTRRYVTIPESIWASRDIFTWVTLLGLGLGTILGTLLAISISKPVRQVTQAVFDLVRGSHNGLLAETGPEEIQVLSRAVNTLLERLQNLELARNRLLSNLVHELGRPLGALQAGTQVLLEGGSDDPEMLEEMLYGFEDEIASLDRLVEDLSHLHEQPLGTLELDNQEIQIHKWLSHSTIAWQEAARKKRLHWHVLAPENLPAIKGDPVRLGQVLGNLLSNAIKYTPSGGSVTISAGVNNDEVWIKVSDTGPGISTEEQQKIFAPFYRVEQTSGKSQGMGLGLSIARDLINAHLGRLEIDSMPGIGSHFTIWLPIHVQPLPVQTGPIALPAVRV